MLRGLMLRWSRSGPRSTFRSHLSMRVFFWRNDSLSSHHALGRRAIGAEQQFRQVVIALTVEPGQLPDPLYPGVDRVRMSAEDAGSLLHIHVGIGDGAQSLDENTARRRIRVDEARHPVRRRG